MIDERRADPREEVAFPVQVDGERCATTRNVSGGGVYLETDGSFQPEGPMVFELQVGNVGFTAEVEVVRVDDGPRPGFALAFAALTLNVIG